MKVTRCCTVFLLAAQLLPGAHGGQSAQRSLLDGEEQASQCADDFCGGIAGLPCECSCPGDDNAATATAECIDDPSDGCDPTFGGADCGGICVCQEVVEEQCGNNFCGGFGGIECDCSCPEGAAAECIDDPSDGCDPNNGGADCGGICVCREHEQEQCNDDFCGGFGGFECDCSCPEGAAVECIDDPSDGCDPISGGADCGGICVCQEMEEVQCSNNFCGGFGGFDCDCSCPEGATAECVDDPLDDCDPNNGGADCGGICTCRENATTSDSPSLNLTSSSPSAAPSGTPSSAPSPVSTAHNSSVTNNTNPQPTSQPSFLPSSTPSTAPSATASSAPSFLPSTLPTSNPSTVLDESKLRSTDSAGNGVMHASRGVSMGVFLLVSLIQCML